jgi:hypothetical protein
MLSEVGGRQDRQMEALERSAVTMDYGEGTYLVVLIP